MTRLLNPPLTYHGMMDWLSSHGWPEQVRIPAADFATLLTRFQDVQPGQANIQLGRACIMPIEDQP